MDVKKKDVSWQSDDDVYLGHDVSSNSIYIGGRYYDSSAQVHLSIDEARWLRKFLGKAIARRNKKPRQGPAMKGVGSEKLQPRT